MNDQYGAAQPLIDLVNKYHDNVSKVLNMIPTFGMKPVPDKDAGSDTSPGKLPPEWEQANQKSVMQTKEAETKPLSQRTLGGKAVRTKTPAQKMQVKRKSE